MKPKQNYNIPEKDRCWTPYYAIQPLLPYLNPLWRIWEPFAGHGYLIDALFESGLTDIWGSELLPSVKTSYGGVVVSFRDFFTYKPPVPVNVIVSNPPFGPKYKVLKHSYELNIPFAYILPLETLGAASGQKLFKKYGVQIIVMDKRVDFGMPNTGFKSSAQFPTAWFTHGLNLPSDLMYAELDKPNKKELLAYYESKRFN